jgi:hypothetical protein
VLFVFVFCSLWRSGGVLFFRAERWRPKHTTKQIVVDTKTRQSVLTALFISWFIDCVVLSSRVSCKKNQSTMMKQKQKIERRNRVDGERRHEWPHRIGDFLMLWPDRQNQNEQCPYLFFIFWFVGSLMKGQSTCCCFLF